MGDFAGVKALQAIGQGALTGTAESTVSGGVATVSVGGIVVTARALRGVTLSVGDPVLVLRQGSAWWVLGATTPTAPVAPEPPDTSPDPKPVERKGTLVATPVYTGTYRDGKWRTDTDDVLQGLYGGYGNNTGCAFYGKTPASLKGATVTSARLKVKRIRAGVFASQEATLRLVTQKTKPSGAPTLTSSTAGPALAVGSSTSSFVVPTSWAQDMVDGTAGGLGVYEADGSPYMRFAGRSEWAPAFTLVIEWKRS